MIAKSTTLPQRPNTIEVNEYRSPFGQPNCVSRNSMPNADTNISYLRKGKTVSYQNTLV